MIKQAIYQLSNKQDLTTEQAIVSMQENHEWNSEQYSNC